MAKLTSEERMKLFDKVYSAFYPPEIPLELQSDKKAWHKAQLYERKCPFCGGVITNPDLKFPPMG